MLDTYATVAPAAELRERIATLAEEALIENPRLKDLNDREDRFLDLIGAPDRPPNEMTARLRDIRDERDRFGRQRDDDENPRLEAARTGPHQLYRRASKHGRRALNQTCFAQQYLDDDRNGPSVAADEPAAPLDHARNESGTAWL